MALVFLDVLPVYDRVRSHPRIARLLARLKLGEPVSARARSAR